MHPFTPTASQAPPEAPRRRTFLVCIAGASLLVAMHPPLALAQSAETYPARALRFIVSFPAGSATDQVARLVGNQITKATGQPVIVENRGGANGFLACDAVAKAAADGYTLLVTTGTTHAANPALFRRLPYDPVKDFAPVTSINYTAFILVVAPAFPANTVGELAALAKAQPGKLTFASGNAPSRIGGEMFRMMAAVDIVHVPYKGAPQALTDIMSGQVNMMWTDLRTGMTLVQAGKLKALAVTGEKRIAPAPHIPTMIEAGYPGYIVGNWAGLYAPAGTPAGIIDRLNAIVHTGVRAEPSAYLDSGGEVLLTSPGEFAALQARDTAMWARVTRAAGMEQE